MEHKIKKNLIVLGSILLLVFFYYQFLPAVKSDNKVSVTIGGENIKAELAVTDAEKSQGLSGRISLAPDEGMLFVFKDPSRQAFWMKDMNFPIDIIWLDTDRKVVYIEKNATPESYPNQFDPGVDAKYVLEVVAGFSDKYNLKVGDQAIFTPTPI